MVIDPDTKGEVELTILKHENGGMFAIDSSFIDQCFDDDEDPIIPDPFYPKEPIVFLRLINTNTDPTVNSVIVGKVSPPFLT
jgi:hypothetical protein